jgi:hypothetical protein
MTAELPVVHLKIRHRPTELAPPSVASEDLLAQTFVQEWILAKSRALNHSHDAS